MLWSGRDRASERRVPVFRVSALALGMLVLALVGAGHQATVEAIPGGPRFREVVYELPADGVYAYREVHILLDDEGGSALPGSLAVARSYVTIGARWATPAMDWAYNPQGSPFADMDFATAGAAAWNAAGFRFSFFGTTADAPGCKDPISEWNTDGHNTVGWAPLPAHVLGRTCVGGHRKLADGTVEIAEADIVFSSTANISAVIAPLVAMHEFGHALGLDHTEAAKCPGPVMCPELTTKTSKVLTQDDLAGAASLYHVLLNRRIFAALSRD